jgi:hypothetical protein
VRFSSAYHAAMATVILTIACGVARGSATNIYIAQSAAGSANGSSCANSYAYSFFNASANWGTGTSQIGPGTTVHLCGTLTNALVAQGSGSSGSPVTILFDSATSGQISMPAIPSTGAIVLSNHSYFTVNGGNVGVIQSTNNGSSASLCSGSPYTNNVMSVGIAAASSSYITVENLTIGPLYIHVCTNDDSTNNSVLSPPGPVCVSYVGTSNLVVTGNTMHDVGWCLNGGGNNLSFYNNVIYNMDHGVGMGLSAASGSMSGISFYNNTLYGANVWDTNDNSFHHDGFHVFAYCANGSSYCSSTYITGVYVYNNTFEGQWGNNVNAHVFFEENIQSAYVFNNFFNGANMVSWGVALLDAQGTNISSFNNTLVGFSTANSFPSPFAVVGAGSVAKNNVIASANSLIGTANNSWESSTYTLANNIFANGGSNSFVWCPPSGSGCSFYASSQFSQWETSSGEVSSSYSSSAGLNANGTLATGSPAIAAGANLYSTCSGQPNPGLGALCYDATGSPRPSTGAWDAGAYNSSSSTPPAPPTQLSAVVQ